MVNLEVYSYSYYIYIYMYTVHILFMYCSYTVHIHILIIHVINSGELVPVPSSINLRFHHRGLGDGRLATIDVGINSINHEYMGGLWHYGIALLR